MSVCQSCGAEVVFVPSAVSGRPMILDAKPSKGVVLRRTQSPVAVGTGPILRSEIVAKVVDVYTDHHATCPDAAAWKGRRR